MPGCGTEDKTDSSRFHDIALYKSRIIASPSDEH